MSIIDTINYYLNYETLQSYIFPLLIVIISIFFSRLITKFVFFIIKKTSEKTGGQWHNTLNQTIKKPFTLFIVLTGFYVAISMFPYIAQNPQEWLVITKCYRSALILIVLWCLYNFTSGNSLMLSSIGKKINLQVSSMMLPILSKTIRLIIIIIAVLVIAEEWNYPISALLTGLGLGGLAFALAAKDMLSNIFGGIVILFDKPFDLGDWIETDMATGTVEDISFRSVKIRTFSQALVTVPNSSIANSAVKNISRMGKRGTSFNIGLSYSTPLKDMQSCTEKIKNAIEQNDDVDNQTVIVVFESLGDSSLNLAVHYFTKTIIWAEHLKVKEKIYYDILEILENHNVEIAFPTQTLHIHNNNK